MKYSSQNPFPRRPSPDKVARGLGLFSLGLGPAGDSEDQQCSTCYGQHRAFHQVFLH